MRKRDFIENSILVHCREGLDEKGVFEKMMSYSSDSRIAIRSNIKRLVREGKLLVIVGGYRTVE